MTEDLELEKEEKEKREDFFTAASASSDRVPGLTFRGLKLSPFERQLITGNRCSAFLDMKCVFHHDSTDVFYATDGFVRLDDALGSGEACLDTVLALCRAFLEALRICGDHLLSWEDLSFQNENIYCARDLSSIRFMYVPGYRNHVSVRDKLVDILDTAIEYDDGEEGTVPFLSEYKNRIYTGGKDLRALKIITDEMIRKNLPDREMDRSFYEEESGRKRRARGMSVRFAPRGDVPPSEEMHGGPPGFLRQETEARVKNRGNQKEAKGGSGFGAKIRDIFNELVS